MDSSAGHAVPALRIELIESIAGLEARAAEIEALLSRADGTLFPAFRPEWILAGRSVYFADKSASLFFLLAWEGARLVALAPMRLERRSLGPLEMRWLGFWGQNTGSPSLDSLTGDFIVPAAADRVRALAALGEFLTGPARQRWDELDLRRFCSTSPNLSVFRDCFKGVVLEEEEMPGFLVELPAHWEVLSAQFGKKTMQNLRRSMRLLDESGHAYRFETVETLSESAFSELAAVHTARQLSLSEKGRHDRDALFLDSERRGAIRGMLTVAAETGRLRVHSLRIEERLAAFAIVLSGADGAVCWLIAFDESFERFSPSRLVFEHMYRTEIQKFSTAHINLLLGFTRTKKELSTTEYKSFRASVPNTWSRRSAIRRTIYSCAKRIWKAVQAVRMWMGTVT